MSLPWASGCTLSRPASASAMTRCSSCRADCVVISRSRTPRCAQAVADALGATLWQVGSAGAKAITVISTEDMTADYLDYHTDAEWLQTVDRGTPLDLLAGEETRAGLKNAIEALPEKERLVMALYYYEELTMKEIGQTMRLTESRVCQLHSQAVLRIRAALRHLREEER